MKVIKKIKLSNFKRFKKFEVAFDEKINLFIGDNEAGKSTVLLALDVVLGGSRAKVESLGLENLLNASLVKEFLDGDRAAENLPVLTIELFLNEQLNPDLNGNHNSDKVECDGLKVTCKPSDEFGKEIKEILSQDAPNFPFEYYSISFTTFSGESYSGYRKFIRHLLLDSSEINNEYATREYIKTIYNSNVDGAEKNKHQNEYRKHKHAFKGDVLKVLNDRLGAYAFSVRTSNRSNLEADLTITEDDISIENKGKGRQCFIKTEFALQKNKKEHQIDLLLLEEPENHLSHTNMKKLIQRLTESENKQIFVATHSNMISARLDLRKAILLNSNSTAPVRLNDLSEQTAKYFIKAPDNNILEFALSRRVLLVEGDAEFILIEALYKNIVKESPDAAGVHVISVDGTSFKRYLDLALLLNIKTAVIRDNDGDAELYCKENYAGYVSERIGIFYDQDNSKKTFETCMYLENKTLCDDLFKEGRKTLSVADYMLKNKTEAAFLLIDKKAGSLVPPVYIKQAIEWIRE
jgi:putative ATP-dependent endonuclease of the OLD family